MTTARAAVEEAEQAARVAGLVIEPVATPDELDVLRLTMHSIWGPEIVPPRNLLRGMAIGGGCLLLARRGEDVVGFALGWVGWEGGVHLHSHQVGVVAAERGGGVGLALKLAQRAQCLQHGITEMRWTFDPLLFSNARFNLVRLGATVVEFLPHCYGDRRDAFNTGERTDRVEVSWLLGAPVGGELLVPRDGDVVIQIPPSYATLRVDEPERARHLRARVGDEFAAALRRGRRVAGLCESGYVLRTIEKS